MKKNNYRSCWQGISSGSVAVILSFAIFLTGCQGASDDVSFTGTEVTGAAVKGPLINAVVDVYLVDYSAKDLKGAYITSGSTNASAAIQGLSISADYRGRGPYLLEISGGAELNNTAPVIPVLTTLLTEAQLYSSTPIYATPLTTMIVEYTKAEHRNTPIQSEAVFANTLNDATTEVKSAFGFGLLDSQVDLFTTPPIFTEGTDQQRSLAYRTASESVAALVNLLNESATSGGASVDGNDVLSGLAMDLTDGLIDGRLGNEVISQYAGINQLGADLTTDVTTLLIPGTNQTIGNMLDAMKNESAALAPGLQLETLSRPLPETIDLNGSNATNGMPIAEAGDDQLVALNSLTTLDGSKSSSPVAGQLIYAWSLVGPDNSSVQLTNADQVRASFTPINTGDYIASLTVSTADGFNSQVDTATLTVLDGQVPPVAVALASDTDTGSAQELNVEALTTGLNSVVNLSASNSRDSNGDSLTYSWRIASSPVGSTVDFTSGTTSAQAALNTGDLQGTIIVEVTVSDGQATATDTVTITANKALPTSGSFMGASILCLLWWRYRQRKRN